ncbi:hypothetical protein AB1E18_012594 [Capra hircus]
MLSALLPRLRRRLRLAAVSSSRCCCCRRRAPGVTAAAFAPASLHTDILPVNHGEGGARERRRGMESERETCRGAGWWRGAVRASAPAGPWLRRARDPLEKAEVERAGSRTWPGKGTAPGAGQKPEEPEEECEGPGVWLRLLARFGPLGNATSPPATIITIIIMETSAHKQQQPEAAKIRNLPWVEKYRPQTLDDLISHQDILSTIQKFISEDRLPHLLLYGPPGTGKTSTILACAKQLYKDKEFGSMVLELNASDDRGIDIVRGPILSFASTRTIFKKGFKLVILDEADAMTQDAQNALRRVIEKFTENTRFCLICNYLSKIIPALQSRCTRFRFGPLTPELMVPRLEHVVEEEKVDISEDGMKALITLSSGDMRRALNILQSTNMAFGKVTEDTVYTCTGHPLKSDIASILDWMLNQDFTTAYRNIMELKTLKGLALHDILTEIHLFVHRVDFPSSVRIHLLTKMADIEYRLSVGTSEKIQLSSLIAAFQVTRDLIVTEA